MKDKQGFKFGAFLVTIGIVYGDIGTSPMYVMKSILEGNGGITQIDSDFIIGSLSLVIWTITLLTTIKYMLIAMKADNHGEGGIFSLYSLVRNFGKWLIVPAMLGKTKEYTQKEIAKNLHISRSYVSRIEKRALTKMLRQYLKNNKCD